MVIGILGSTGIRAGLTRAGTWIGSSAGRAGAAGIAGGMLADDIPLVGDAIDPTEQSGGGGSDTATILVYGALLIGAVIALGSLFDIQLGGE